MNVAHSQPACTAILVAAGSSQRMGFDKLSAPILGTPVFTKTFQAFLAVGAISEIIIVGPTQRMDLLAGIEYSTPVICLEGGPTRQDSVSIGLAHANCDYVAVHDAARPLITPAVILQCLHEALIHQAVALARPVTETLKRGDSQGYNLASVSREHLWFMETPQIFKTQLLRDAYAKVAKEGAIVTDEVSAVETLGTRVKFIQSHHLNLKITTPSDLALAEAYCTLQ